MAVEFFEGFYKSGSVANTNNSNRFWLITGVDCGSGFTSSTSLAVGSAKSEIQVLDSAGNVIDSVAIETYSSAAATTYGMAVVAGLFKKLLVPPNGTIKFPQASPTVWFSGLSGSLEDLRGFI